MMNEWTENEFCRIGEKEKNNMFIYYVPTTSIYVLNQATKTKFADDDNKKL